MSAPNIWQDKRVLITGGAGFIGSNLALRLIRERSLVSIVDNFCPTAGGNHFNLAPIAKQIQFRQGDIGDSALMDFIKDQDIIFNLAGLLNHQDSMTAPLTDLKANVESHLKFLELCRKVNPVATVVYASTRQIYGHPVYLPVDESHPICPIDINGIHKYAAEQYHSLFHRVYGLKTVSLRLTNTYGPRQFIKNSRQGVVGWFVNRILTEQPIHLFGGGDVLRDFNHVDDVVDALFLAAITPGCMGRVFNLSGEKATLEQLAQSLSQIGTKTQLEKIPFPEGRDRIALGHYYGTSALFKKVTGWTPKTSLTDGLSNTVSYFRENQKEYIQEATL